MRKQQEIAKRAFDILASSASLAFLSPLLLLIALAIRIEDGGPALFSQHRMGKDFVPFRLFKFRTMVADADKSGPGVTAAGDERITRVGRFMRKKKLDELPQLFNVLKGDMSIVGPRPEDPRYVEIFRDDYEVILSVKPGLTDFATLEFVDEESVLAKYDDPERAYIEQVLPRKIQLSKEYVAENSFAVDISVILRTLMAVITTK